MGKRKRELAIYSTTGALRNRKWEIFATELATGAPLEESYVTAGFQAGYSAKFNASRLRNHPVVKARIEELLDGFQQQSFLKLEWVLRELTRIVELRDPSKLIVKADGEKVTEFDRHGALQSIGRLLGGDMSRPELDATPARWRRMSDEERRFRINAVLEHERKQVEIEARKRIAGASSLEELSALEAELETEQ